MTTDRDDAFIIKVCGVTNEEDAREAIAAGANAIGFNFYPKSPRYVSPRVVREIVRAVSGSYLKVGVFVDADPEELMRVECEVPLDVAQLHGRVPTQVPKRAWKSIVAGTAMDSEGGFEAFLLDTATPLYGGSGLPFDWRLAANFLGRAILAGGLDGSNVGEAIRVAEPWGVDACSRLEVHPGKKDRERVREFVRAAQEAFALQREFARGSA